MTSIRRFGAVELVQFIFGFRVFSSSTLFLSVTQRRVSKAILSDEPSVSNVVLSNANQMESVWQTFYVQDFNLNFRPKLAKLMSFVFAFPATSSSSGVRQNCRIIDLRSVKLKKTFDGPNRDHRKDWRDDRPLFAEKPPLEVAIRIDCHSSTRSRRFFFRRKLQNKKLRNCGLNEGPPLVVGPFGKMIIFNDEPNRIGWAN